MGNSPSTNLHTGCDEDSPLASTIGHPKDKDGNELPAVVFMKAGAAKLTQGASPLFYAQVCGPPGKGAMTTQWTNQTAVGCVVANGMCCGGKSQPHCMLNPDNNGGVTWDQSGIGRIKVPCGVKVTASYNTTQCKGSDDDHTVTVIGDGTTKPLKSDSSTGTIFPYAFGVSLLPGYECDGDGHIVTKIGKQRVKKCAAQPLPQRPDAPTPSASGAMSRTQVLALVFGACAVAVLLLFALAPSKKKDPLLTVDEIVQQAGVNQHLRAPTAPKISNASGKG
tara:strand:+ start:106 stop:942 length:837 start_codon:yes stop_codon:yes gene_type:complete